MKIHRRGSFLSLIALTLRGYCQATVRLLSLQSQPESPPPLTTITPDDLTRQGVVSKKILRLRYTLGTSSSFRRNTTSAIVSQQTIVTTTSSHFKSKVTFENTRNRKIMIFVKRIFAPAIGLRLRSLLRFFVKRPPGLHICSL